MNFGGYRPNASLYTIGWGLGGLSGLQDSGRHVHSQSCESPGLRHHASHHFLSPFSPRDSPLLPLKQSQFTVCQPCVHTDASLSTRRIPRKGKVSDDTQVPFVLLELRLCQVPLQDKVKRLHGIPAEVFPPQPPGAGRVRGVILIKEPHLPREEENLG